MSELFISLYRYSSVLCKYNSSVLFSHIFRGKILIQTAVTVLILQSSPYWFTAPCHAGAFVIYCASVHVYFLLHTTYILHIPFMVILVLKSITLNKSRIPSTKQNYSPHGDRGQGQGSSSQKEPRGYHYPVLCVYQLTETGRGDACVSLQCMLLNMYIRVWEVVSVYSVVAISKKFRFSGPTPSNGPCNGCQNHYIPHHINNTAICNWIYILHTPDMNPLNYEEQRRRVIYLCSILFV